MKHIVMGIALSLAALVVNLSTAHALKCKEHVYEGDGSGSKCCNEILAGGHWWGEDADGYHMDCTEYTTTIEDAPPGPCEAEIYDCLPDGDWPFDPPSWWPEEWGGGGGAPPPPPPSTAPNCNANLCWEGKNECLADADIDHFLCMSDFNHLAENDCGDGNGRTGVFRSGYEFEYGDMCTTNIRGHVCNPDDPTIDRSCSGYGTEFFVAEPDLVPCNDICIDSWMNGDSSSSSWGVISFKIKWSMKGPTAEVGFNRGVNESFASYTSGCNARRAEFRAGCTYEAYPQCTAQQRAACPSVWIPRVPTETGSFGVTACYGHDKVINLHYLQ